MWEELGKIVHSLDLWKPDLYLLKNCGLRDLSKVIHSCNYRSENPKEKSEFFPC